MKKIIKKITPNFILSWYHFILSFLGALIYGFPSKKMTVIGVTGTKGKTTTSYLIAQILSSAGFKTGMATTVIFKIGDREWLNESKQTMLGRLELQKLLSQMVKENCKYAVIETSSEGILQYRHRFVNYDVAVFTNLTPEHIERHGGFENYRDAKIKPFEKVAKKKKGVGVYNFDDKNIGYFLKPTVKTKYGYSVSGVKHSVVPPLGIVPTLADFLFVASGVKLKEGKTEFKLNDEKFEIPLIGEFNVYNAAAAICVALSQNIPMAQIKKALADANPAPGRMEVVDGKNFKIIIDYAHEPASLEAAYKTLSSQLTAHSSRLICLLGGQGGGRDKWKRPEMGKIAAKYCDEIILTNEDPYDENPANILDDIEAGFSQVQSLKLKVKSGKLYKILDRREAIKKAISLAKKDDIVILTGKGGEVWMCVENGKKIPWNEKEIVGEILEKVK
ncbi:UDP-N-acetylmuramoyl-L-alanyl-D-glutamate--2,6-diaminopimelate ligase [Candidatus Wolfebacteria bacterium]|nr:UDP-N-acetylmuramoyl-L-alanyl-D-glutamate--2,6-diaminopimelate ligase [Candidatus Wolfebacteria bacterium]